MAVVEASWTMLGVHTERVLLIGKSQELYVANSKKEKSGEGHSYLSLPPLCAFLSFPPLLMEDE